ncbi:hypothetical protein RvY_10166 [Ramazzottius varieornatus]|uniref:Uncharacterized protein n=1 Tax=Ramazzottius varieornatus TaxID=947166 RepID=A0A1D1VGD2_RAMVA|nr:hypothetical protein RvY_10166 [Ramazzottius varieornatus]
MEISPWPLAIDRHHHCQCIKYLLMDADVDLKIQGTSSNDTKQEPNKLSSSTQRRMEFTGPSERRRLWA